MTQYFKMQAAQCAGVTSKQYREFSSYLKSRIFNPQRKSFEVISAMTAGISLSQFSKMVKFYQLLSAGKMSAERIKKMQEGLKKYREEMAKLRDKAAKKAKIPAKQYKEYLKILKSEEAKKHGRMAGLYAAEQAGIDSEKYTEFSKEYRALKKAAKDAKKAAKGTKPSKTTAKKAPSKRNVKKAA